MLTISISFSLSLPFPLSMEYFCRDINQLNTSYTLINQYLNDFDKEVNSCTGGTYCAVALNASSNIYIYIYIYIYSIFSLSLSPALLSLLLCSLCLPPFYCTFFFFFYQYMEYPILSLCNVFEPVHCLWAIYMSTHVCGVCEQAGAYLSTHALRSCAEVVGVDVQGMESAIGYAGANGNPESGVLAALSCSSLNGLYVLLSICLGRRA